VQLGQGASGLFVDECQGLGGSTQIARSGEDLACLRPNGDGGDVMGNDVVQLPREYVALVTSDSLELLPADDAAE